MYADRQSSAKARYTEGQTDTQLQKGARVAQEVSQTLTGPIVTRKDSTTPAFGVISPVPAPALPLANGPVGWPALFPSSHIQSTQPSPLVPGAQQRRSAFSPIAAVAVSVPPPPAGPQQPLVMHPPL